MGFVVVFDDVLLLLLLMMLMMTFCRSFSMFVFFVFLIVFVFPRTVDGVGAGFLRQAEGFSFLQVFEAGHMVRDTTVP